MASSSSTVRVDAQRTALLAAPTVESESDYYATLAAASSADVRVARVTHGKSLVAARAFKRGERVFHQKFGYGTIKSADGSKLTVKFEKAGEKKVLDGFVSRP